MKHAALKLFKSELLRIRSDWQFYKKHTELIAIYTVLYAVITWLFWSSVTSSWIELLAVFVLIVIFTYAVSLFTIFYCSKVKYADKKNRISKVHGILNFDLEGMF
ncbi:MAG: hypothetical protein HY429_01025 [Candidatus Levybacteria bacterium]|nr:hypothetical protein [Candidatus Levybacteria bacterium]